MARDGPQPHRKNICHKISLCVSVFLLHKIEIILDPIGYIDSDLFLPQGGWSGWKGRNCIITRKFGLN